jgi:hypothetical protein
MRYFNLYNVGIFCMVFIIVLSVCIDRSKLKFVPKPLMVWYICNFCIFVVWQVPFAFRFYKRASCQNFYYYKNVKHIEDVVTCIYGIVGLCLVYQTETIERVRSIGRDDVRLVNTIVFSMFMRVAKELALAALLVISALCWVLQAYCCKEEPEASEDDDKLAQFLKERERVFSTTQDKDVDCCAICLNNLIFKSKVVQL